MKALSYMGNPLKIFECTYNDFEDCPQTREPGKLWNNNYEYDPFS